jgi:carbon monoxide dehydrogenase subunit G
VPNELYFHKMYFLIQLKMTRFISNRLPVNASKEQVFDFLSDFTHFENLMPAQIKNWKADADHCSFTIEGMADLSMRIAAKNPYQNIHIVADGKNPIDYTLDVFLFDKNENLSDVEISFDASLNPFIKAVASKPLQNFVDMLAQRIKEHFA